MALMIEICTFEEDNTKNKGDLLENLTTEVLKILQFTVKQEVKVTGAELDCLAIHNKTNEKIYVECKGHKNNIQAPVLRQLFGTVTLKNYAAGWLITTSELGKEAKGIEEELNEEQRKKLVIYDPKSLIQLLMNANKIIEPSKLKKTEQFSYSNDKTLIITPIGRYWTCPILNTKQGIPTECCVYDAETGTPITDEDVLDNLAKTDSSFKDFTWIPFPENNDYSSVDEDEENFLQNVVPVTPGDDWFDYRPCRPENFVGRVNIIDDFLEYLNKVRNNQTDTRLVAISSPSGWGKSSLVLKLSQKSRNKRNKNKFFIYTADCRTATDSRYAERLLIECLRKAKESEFIPNDLGNISISSPNNPFGSESISKVLDYLKSQDKVIVLFLDQFEEVFSKLELENLFNTLKTMSFNLDSIKENFVLGFSWKTDGVSLQDHPAYSLWHNLSDKRREFSLTPFNTKEISTCITGFEKELGQSLNLIIKRHLRDHCQGYPWLLKKLCIHINSSVKAGLSIADITNKSINIKSLFEKDMDSLPPLQASCVLEVAKKSPADFFNIQEMFGEQTIESSAKV
jgi:hypothetical protein